jgi:plastocyanin domain-containing protein
MEGNMRVLWASSAVLILLLGSVVYGQEVKENRFVAIIGADGVQRAEITGGSYYFDPDYIVVKVNVPVELKVKKAGGMTPHSIALQAPEAGISFSVSLGKEPKSITFTPTKVGKYPFWCTKRFLFLKSHKDHGMTGMLEVVE